MAKPKAKTPDPLDAFVANTKTYPDWIPAMLLWKARHQNPEMAVLVTPEDLRAYSESMDYQKIKPEILVYRPEGRPATAAIPAAGNRRAVPARPAEPPRPFVIIGLVERGTRNAVKPIENNEQDYERGELVRQIQVARRNIPDLAASLRRTAATGDFTTATLEDAARTLELFGRQP
jgi:hypothetical protein